MPRFSDLTGKCDVYFACNSKTDLVLTFFGVHGNILGQGTEAVRCAQFVSSASSLVHYESSIYWVSPPGNHMQGEMWGGCSVKCETNTGFIASIVRHHLRIHGHC